jgi:hypothetical protein
LADVGFTSASNRALRWNVPAGTASTSIARLRLQPYARLSLYQHSIVRTGEQERCKLPRRTRALDRPSYLDPGMQISHRPLRYDPGDVFQENRSQCSCTGDTPRLSHGIDWVGHPDRQIAAQSFLLGAASALRTSCSESRNGESSRPRRLDYRPLSPSLLSN